MLEPYLYPFILLFLLLPAVIFVFQRQYPFMARYNNAMLYFMKIFFFILSFAVLGFGFMSLAFQGEYVREPSAFQGVFKVLTILMLFAPLASALWFAFLRHKIPLRLGAWLPLIVTIASTVLAYIVMIITESL